MRLRIIGLGMAFLTFASVGAHAQDAALQKQQDQGITVTGERPAAPAIVRGYVRQISPNVNGQLPRFHDPICPEVIGMSDRYAQIIMRRIRTVAAGAGIKVAKEKCHPNLVLMFASSSDDLVKAMRSKVPWIFDGVINADLQRAYESGPVHAWVNTETHNEYDMPTSAGGTMKILAGSRIRMPVQQVILSSVVAIDQDEVPGRTLNQIADYAVMRGLAGARPPKQGIDADTILTLFDANGTPPLEATSMDRSYLAGLYRTQPTARGGSAKGAILRDIVKKGGQKPKD
jgi:hypothetical protein